jgi:3-isopropylmalate/(R)-2-methylmalate dehydratase small subunit
MSGLNASGLKTLRNRVGAVLGNNIDTDVIYPGRYLNITDRDKTAEHLFELAYPDIRPRWKAGEFLVGGKNFGCGSSREQATAAVKYAGVGAVIAASFARIFYRNSLNLGLPLVVSPEASRSIQQGDEIEIALEEGVIRNLTRKEVYPAAPLDAKAVELLEAGGLISYLKQKYAEVRA